MQPFQRNKSANFIFARRIFIFTIVFPKLQFLRSMNKRMIKKLLIVEWWSELRITENGTEMDT